MLIWWSILLVIFIVFFVYFFRISLSATIFIWSFLSLLPIRLGFTCQAFVLLIRTFFKAIYSTGAITIPAGYIPFWSDVFLSPVWSPIWKPLSYHVNRMLNFFDVMQLSCCGRDLHRFFQTSKQHTKFCRCVIEQPFRPKFPHFLVCNCQQIHQKYTRTRPYTNGNISNLKIGWKIVIMFTRYTFSPRNSW